MDERDQGFLGLGLLIGFIMGMIISGYIYDWGGEASIEQLGKSICEEEYGMDFESYIDNTLRCKPFTESYDGIKVEFPKVIEVIDQHSLTNKVITEE